MYGKRRESAAAAGRDWSRARALGISTGSPRSDVNLNYNDGNYGLVCAQRGDFIGRRKLSNARVASFSSFCKLVR